jgi:hypothetical protein
MRQIGVLAKDVNWYFEELYTDLLQYVDRNRLGFTGREMGRDGWVARSGETGDTASAWTGYSLQNLPRLSLICRKQHIYTLYRQI